MRLFDIPEMNAFDVIRVTLSLLRPYWFRVITIVPMVFLSSAFQSVNATLVVPIMLMFFGGSASAEQGPLLDLYSRLLSAVSAQGVLYLVASTYLATSLLKAMFGYLTEVLSFKLSLDLLVELRQQILRSYLSSSYRFFLDRKQGELINDITAEPDLTADTVRNVISGMSEVLTLVGLIVVLFLLSWQITLVLAAGGILIFVLLGAFTRWAKRLSVKEVENRRAILSHCAESISGIRQIKVFSAEGRIAETFHAVSVRLRDTGLSAVKMRSAGQKMVDAIVGTGIAALLLVIPVVFSNDLKAAGFTFVPLYMVSTRIFPVVAALNYLRVLLVGRGSSVGVVERLIRTTQDGETGRDGERRFGKLSREIAFENVTFEYVPGTPVLSKLSVSFEAGKTTAIVGASGAGKSTIVDVIVRLFEPQSGRVTIDGVDIREYDLRSLRNAIGFVSQDTFIFNGSVQDNILFGKPGATNEEVLEAARLANVHDFITELPDGYATIVGDRGLKLSGGQRQRIAIARALVRNPQILIFDEATSALDNVAEALVQQAIDQVGKDRTVIVVAHRLSTIANADKIVVLDKGEIVEAGTHNDLLACSGHYWKFYWRSASEDVEEARVAKSTLISGLLT